MVCCASTDVARDVGQASFLADSDWLLLDTPFERIYLETKLYTFYLGIRLKIDVT